jgi:outer membrane protein
MKKLFKVALVAVCMVFMGNFAKAQTKIGHIDFGAVYTAMPDFKTINTQMQAYQQQFVDALTVMGKEYETKMGEYSAKQATMTDAVRMTKQSELQDLQKRSTDYQNTAKQKVDDKAAELSKPLIDKVRAAITAVAKEKGYAYVIDSSQTQLLVAPDADDLLVPVKAKLGLK